MPNWLEEVIAFIYIIAGPFVAIGAFAGLYWLLFVYPSDLLAGEKRWSIRVALFWTAAATIAVATLLWVPSDSVLVVLMLLCAMILLFAGLGIVFVRSVIVRILATVLAGLACAPLAHAAQVFEIVPNVYGIFLMISSGCCIFVIVGFWTVQGKIRKEEKEWRKERGRTTVTHIDPDPTYTPPWQNPTWREIDDMDIARQVIDNIGGCGDI